MKKMLAVLLVLVFSLGALAETATVKFNFPIASGIDDITTQTTFNEDENAFSVFSNAATQSGANLSVTFYSFGAFIECVKEICGSSDFTKYWMFSTNNEPASVGVSDYIVNGGDTISLDYFEGNGLDALEWLFDNQKENGSVGTNNFQHAFALMGMSLAQENELEMNEKKTLAQQFLLLQQENGASFGDDLQSAVSTMALLSSGKTLEDFDVDGKTTLDALLENQQADGGFKSGASESDVDTTTWAAIAFAQAGKNQPINSENIPVEFLLSAQHENGSFGYLLGDSLESIDFSEEALIALSAAGAEKNSAVSKGLDFLKGKQGEDGCIQDGFRTGLGAIAFRVWDEGQAEGKATECLKTLQKGDGSFGRNTNQSNAMDTAIAAIALFGKKIPLTVAQTHDDNSTTEGDGIVGLNNIAKFSVKIKNSGEVSAQNVKIKIEGIPSNWIINQGSTFEFPEIKKGETKTAEIFVQLKEKGNYTAKAVVSTTSSLVDFLSNLLGLNVKEAQLSVQLGITE